MAIDIADEYDVPSHVIYEYLRKFNIPKHPNEPKFWKDILTKDYLYEQYIIQNKSIVKISEEVGCCFSVVSRWLKKHNIKKVRLTESITKEYLIEEYINKKREPPDIAKEFDCFSSFVYKKLIQYNIPIREYTAKFTDLTNQRVGRLLVIEVDKERTRPKHRYWFCKCDCGNVKSVSSNVLLDKRIVSCGCYNVEIISKGFEDISGSYWSRIRKGARIRKLDFEITIEDAWKLFISQDRKCKFTGIELKFGNKKAGSTASLDRIDSSKGYTIDNIQWVHKTVNIIKMALPDEVFIFWCRKVSENTKDRELQEFDTDFLLSANPRK